MNIIQTLRRIGQLFHKSSDDKDYQMKLIMKLYLKNGLEIFRTCSGWPEQYEIFKDNKQVAYYRLRHGVFTVEYPDCGGELIFKEEPLGDGVFYDSERLMYLSSAMKYLIKKL